MTASLQKKDSKLWSVNTLKKHKKFTKRNKCFSPNISCQFPDHHTPKKKHKSLNTRGTPKNLGNSRKVSSYFAWLRLDALRYVFMIKNYLCKNWEQSWNQYFLDVKTCCFSLGFEWKGGLFSGDLISVLRYVSKIILVYLHVFLYVI